MEAQDPAHALLHYEAELVGAQSAAEASFIAVNRLGGVLSYRLAVLLEPDPIRHARITAVSHLYEVDENAPFAQWLARLVRHCGDTPVSLLAATDLPDALAQDWGEWLPEHAAVCRLVTPAGVVVGWMVVAFEGEVEDSASALLQLACRQVSLVLGSWQARGWWARLRRSKFLTLRNGAIALVVVIAILAFPVRLSALAPAEVTPIAPAAVTAPAEGVLARFQVPPNTMVRAGDVVALMDDTVVRNRHAVALKGLEIARAEFARAGSKSFGDDQSRADLLTLRARVDEKQAEVSYNEDLLNRLQLRAPAAGLVIYSSPDEWEGRPLATGERIATVADPRRVGLTLHLAPDDTIPIEPGSEVRFFMNVSPLDTLDGRVTQIGYEAESTVDAGLAYSVRAQFNPGTELPRLGLRGTARIYSSRVPLGYYLLRRPIGSLRRMLGL